MDSKPIGALAIDAPVLGEDATCGDIQRVFRRQPRLSGILLSTQEGIALVDRAAFDALTLRESRETAADRPALEVADPNPLVIPDDQDLLDASTHVLERRGPSLYEDVVVQGPDGSVRLVPVSRMLAELTQLYRHQARHDVLTGLANRTLVLERLTAMLSRAARHGGLVAALFIDLDGFKRINDTHGHQAGDRLLMHVAQRLRDAGRTHDLVGRLGGDEFVLAATVNNVDDLPGLASRVVDALEEPFPIEDGPAVRVRASVGVAADDGERTADEVLRLADNAMYSAKRTSGSGVAFAHQLPSSPYAASASDDRAMAILLEQALTDGTLRLAYQPIVDLETGALTRVEVLARMPLPDGELVPPDRFVAVAEQSDLIDRLGRWVLAESLDQLMRWDQVLGTSAPAGVSVNLSPLQCQDPHLPNIIGDALNRAGIAPDRLWVEVPESVVTLDDPSMRRALSELDQLGVRVTIDDFGIGDTTLGRIAELPIHELKIDRSLISGFMTQPSQRQVVRMIVELGRVLDVSVVAEGVETGGQVRLLRVLGCPAAQGYRFGRPMWANDLRGHLTELAS